MRRQVLGPVIAVLILATAAAGWLIHHFDPSTPHGAPDPGGHRLAYLTRTARAAVPTGGSAISLRIQRYAWNAGGCDGGAAGWARAEVDVRFRVADVASIDTAMAGLRWKRLPVEGGDAVRDYVPGSGNPYDADATLFGAAPSWELELSAAPAHVPTHDC